MIVWHKDQKGHWDHELLIDMLDDDRFHMKQDGCIYIVPGEYENAGDVNAAIEHYKWVILIVTSDEQSKFDIENVHHDNIEIWVQYPKVGRHDEYHKLTLGYTPHTRRNLELTNKPSKIFFSGQITHDRRRQFYKKLVKIPGAKINKTDGFSQGLTHNEYMLNMNQARVVPSPGGPICPDSFRTCEALEVGALPIADAKDSDRDYVQYLYGDTPMARIIGLTNLEGYINDELSQYPVRNNEVQAWWIKYKRDLKHKFLKQIEDFSGDDMQDFTTVIVPTSPIKSNPSTKILGQCIKSIRKQLPKAEIIITFDGVRPEQEDRRADYNEFIRRALFHCNTDWNATPLIFTDHTHQVGMMREAMKMVETPTVVYVEGDTGFVDDKKIDWSYCMDKLQDGTSNMIRFHYQGHIDKEHKHLMLNQDDRLIETYQYSQRPHIANTAYYERLLNMFSPDANSFIEDKLHSVLMTDYNEYKRNGWLQHRLHIYAPEDNLHYSVHLDGREGEDKYDDTQVF